MGKHKYLQYILWNSYFPRNGNCYHLKHWYQLYCWLSYSQLLYRSCSMVLWKCCQDNKIALVGRITNVLKNKLNFQNIKTQFSSIISLQNHMLLVKIICEIFGSCFLCFIESYYHLEAFVHVLLHYSLHYPCSVLPVCCSCFHHYVLLWAHEHNLNIFTDMY